MRKKEYYAILYSIIAGMSLTPAFTVHAASTSHLVVSDSNSESNSNTDKNGTNFNTEDATEISEQTETGSTDTETNLQNSPFENAEDENIEESATNSTETTDTSISTEDASSDISDSATENEIDKTDSGDNIKSVEEQEGERTGAVTFQMNVPSNFTEPIYVTFVEIDSYEEYYVKAYNSAGYKTTVYLEPGTYMITDGYPINDNTSSYSVQDAPYFIVEEDSTPQTVTVTIKSKGDIIKELLNEKNDEETATDDVDNTEEDSGITLDQKEKNGHRKLYAILAAILFTVGGIGAWLLVKFLKKTSK